MSTESYKEKVDFIVDLYKSGVFDIYTPKEIVKILKDSKNYNK